LGIAVLAVAPKCLLCFAAYAGVGATLVARLGGREMCGVSAGLPDHLVVACLALFGVTAGVVAYRRRRSRRTLP
jgi:hypothetical protein